MEYYRSELWDLLSHFFQESARNSGMGPTEFTARISGFVADESRVCASGLSDAEENG
jgi:hypothetical protein